MFNSIQKDYDCMTLTLPDDKKDFVKKEVKAVSDKLEVVGRFKEKVDIIDDYVSQLNNFDVTLKAMDKWMKEADANLDEIRNHSHKLTPEDRVSSTMELQEDVAEKVEIINKAIASEKDLLPQGDEVPEDVKYWAEYKTGIRGFRPWLESSEEKAKGGLSK